MAKWQDFALGAAGGLASGIPAALQARERKKDREARLGTKKKNGEEAEIDPDAGQDILDELENLPELGTTVAAGRALKESLSDDDSFTKTIKNIGISAAKAEANRFINTYDQFGLTDPMINLGSKFIRGQRDQPGRDERAKQLQERLATPVNNQASLNLAMDQNTASLQSARRRSDIMPGHLESMDRRNAAAFDQRGRDARRSQKALSNRNTRMKARQAEASAKRNSLEATLSDRRQNLGRTNPNEQRGGAYRPPAREEDGGDGIMGGIKRVAGGVRDVAKDVGGAVGGALGNIRDAIPRSSPVEEQTTDRVDPSKRYQPAFSPTDALNAAVERDSGQIGPRVSYGTNAAKQGNNNEMEAGWDWKMNRMSPEEKRRYLALQGRR